MEWFYGVTALKNLMVLAIAMILNRHLKQVYPFQDDASTDV